MKTQIPSQELEALSMKFGAAVFPLLQPYVHKYNNDMKGRLVILLIQIIEMKLEIGGRDWLKYRVMIEEKCEEILGKPSTNN